MSSRILLKDIADKLKSTVKIEDADYQLLSALYELYFDKYSFTLPINGEVAREEHVVEPFMELERQDRLIQDLLGQILEDSENLDINTQEIKEQIVHQLNYLKSEANYWKLQRQSQSEDVVEFFESFAPGFTLPITTPQNQLNSLSEVKFVPANPLNDPPAGLLPERFYSFGQPFIQTESADPVEAIKNQQPIHFQGIVLLNDVTDVDYYLQRNCESVNGLL